MYLQVNTRQIYVAMAEKGYNGADLARAAGVTPAAVSSVLNGKRLGTTKVIGSICKALGLSVGDVLQTVDL